MPSQSSTPEVNMAFLPLVRCESDGSKGDSKNEHKEMMREMLGPNGVDQHIRQAISTCWMTLPEEKKNSKAVAIEIRRIVERALTSLKEDATAFGFTK
jgi:hypothetical protein